MAFFVETKKIVFMKTIMLSVLAMLAFSLQAQSQSCTQGDEIGNFIALDVQYSIEYCNGNNSSVGTVTSGTYQCLPIVSCGVPDFVEITLPDGTTYRVTAANTVDQRNDSYGDCYKVTWIDLGGSIYVTVEHC